MDAKNSAFRKGADCYLDDLLGEIKFDLKQEEVNFIQNGIETIVTNIIDNIVVNSKHVIEGLKKALIVDRLRCQGIEFKELTSSNRLIKAGSFYEKTKNHFPDEFDFVFVMGTFEVTNSCAVELFLPDLIARFDAEDFLFDLFSNHSRLGAKLCFYERSDTQPCSALRCIEHVLDVQKNGPAAKLQFVYTSEYGCEREINVDFVPAFKLIDPFLDEDMLNSRWICSIPEFNRSVSETGSYIVVSTNGIVSFTEAEVKFMTEVLSPHHIKVYRLVKQLINGQFGEEFKEFCTTRMIKNLDISSYTIKTTTIYHHSKCLSKKDDRKTLAECVQDILLDLQGHVSKGIKRHIITKIENNNNDDFEANIIGKTKYERPQYVFNESPGDRRFRIRGSKYLIALRESLGPQAWHHMFTRIDRCYSKYILDG